MYQVLPMSPVLCHALYMHGIIYYSEHLYVIVFILYREKLKFRENKQLASIRSVEVCLYVITIPKVTVTCSQMRKQTKRGEVMSPRSHSQLMMELELEPSFQPQSLASFLLHEHPLFSLTWVQDHVA